MYTIFGAFIQFAYLFVFPTMKPFCCPCNTLRDRPATHKSHSLVRYRVRYKNCHV